jgi:hypothetical protein
LSKLLRSDRDEVQRPFGKRFRTACSQYEIVFEPNALPQPRRVSARINRESVAYFKRGVAKAVDVRPFMQTKPDAVAAVVREAALAQVRVFADPGVDLLPKLQATGARFDESRDLGEDFGKVVVYASLERRGIAPDDEAARESAPVTVHLRLCIDYVDLASLDWTVPRLPSFSARTEVAAEVVRPPSGRLRSLLTLVEDFHFANARPNDFASAFERSKGRPHRAANAGDLVGVLALLQRV